LLPALLLIGIDAGKAAGGRCVAIIPAPRRLVASQRTRTGGLKCFR